MEFTGIHPQCPHMVQLTTECRFVNVVCQAHLGRTILEGVTHRDVWIVLEYPVPHGELVEIDIQQRVHDRHSFPPCARSPSLLRGTNPASSPSAWSTARDACPPRQSAGRPH